jgi:photosystem II stability/assembly factor-like uncharacterized protein
MILFKFTIFITLLLGTGQINVDLNKKPLRKELGVKKIELSTNRSLYSISFPEKDFGWIGGSAGTLLKTINGGESWEIVQIPNVENRTLRKIYFLTKDVGWVVSSPREFLYQNNGEDSIDISTTRDGGKSWTMKKLDEGVRIYRIKFRGKDQGWMVGVRLRKGSQATESEEGSYVLYTKDGGITWDNISSNVKKAFPEIGIIRDVDFVANSQVIFFCDREPVISSSDGVGNWSILPTPEEQIFDIGNYDFVAGLLLNEKTYQVISSIQNNMHGVGSVLTTWESKTSNHSDRVVGIAFYEAVSFLDGSTLAVGGEGWFTHDDNQKVVLPRGVVYSSTPKGADWKEILPMQKPKTNEDKQMIPLLLAVTKSSEKEAWAVGARGTLLKITRN